MYRGANAFYGRKIREISAYYKTRNVRLTARSSPYNFGRVLPMVYRLGPYENFIRGRWTPSRGGATFGDENPAHRGSNLGAFQSSTVDDVRDAIDAAADAFRSWRRTSVADRQRHVAAFLNLLKDSREELARIVTLENGKTIRESRAEVDSALVEGGYHLQQVAGFYESAGRSAFSRAHDVGASSSRSASSASSARGIFR